VIVDACGGDVGMPEPFLHLGDVGLVIERVSGGRRPRSAWKRSVDRIARSRLLLMVSVAGLLPYREVDDTLDLTDTG